MSVTCAAAFNPKVWTYASAPRKTVFSELGLLTGLPVPALPFAQRLGRITDENPYAKAVLNRAGSRLCGTVHRPIEIGLCSMVMRGRGMQLDKAAVKILMQTFWSATGWKQNYETADADFEYAKSKGVMFDPIAQTHDEAVVAAVRAVQAVSRERVAAAFLSSLSSRRLELRSALATYSVGRNLQPHSFSRLRPGHSCGYCEDYGWAETDFNVLNFERIKWGGVRHSNPRYIAFDLQQLARMEMPAPTAEDVAILKAILDAADELPAGKRLGDLDKALAKIVRSNSAERRTLIGALGYAGVLIDPSRPDFRQGFVPAVERAPTPWHKDDWPYPVCWWASACGVNRAAVAEWFPQLG